MTILFQRADDDVYSPKDWWMRKNLYLSTTEFKELLILCETYISVTVEESKVQPTGLKFLLSFLLFLRPPGNGNDLRVIAPGLFPQNRSQKQSQVYFHSLLASVSRHRFFDFPRCYLPAAECAIGPTTLWTVSWPSMLFASRAYGSRP